MSYADFLNRKRINSPNIIDQRRTFGDASSFINRTRLAAGIVRRPTDHVITNVSDPSVVPNMNSKKPTVYIGKGFGGKVMDASQYTATRGAAAIGADVFSPVKVINGAANGVNFVLPPASQVINRLGNADGKKKGLNLDHQATCAIFKPQTKSYFVDTLPAIAMDKVGVSAKSGTSKGVQNTLTCTTTFTTGAPQNSNGTMVAKEVKIPNLHPKGPKKNDFLTAPTGPQISKNGAGVRAPKVGGAVIHTFANVAKHHGKAWGPRPYPAQFVPPTGAPAQLKINSPMHYFVA
jgi:hypothetical protein